MKTVLVIDDSRDSQVLVKRILEKEQYNVITASSGREGVTMARNNNPDLILLDVMMPVNDGKETAAYLQAVRQYTNIPVIFVTGITSQEGSKGWNVMSVEEREYLVLPKPVDRVELIKRVTAALA